MIDPTLVVWRLREPEPEERTRRRLDRVSDWYRRAAHEPLASSVWSQGTVGLAAFCDPAVRSSWPAWLEREGLVMASAYAPTGWERITGASDPAEAAPLLARELATGPGRCAEELNSPAVIAVAASGRSSIALMNDRLGAGRLFEYEFEGGMAWSNRAGALPLFAGVPARASVEGWAMFAAGGWFMGPPTAYEGVTKVPPGTVVTVAPEGARRAATGALERLVAPGGDPARASLEAFSEQAQSAVRAAEALYPEEPRVDLSGGRDSRVSAAAAVAAGVGARFRTSDIATGEADVARALVAALPSAVDHEVSYEGERTKVRRTELRERARRALLLHDGMRHAGKVRGGLRIPPPIEASATLSGHGGEIGHGFYYSNRRQLRSLERGGRDALLERLDRACRRKHQAAHERVYALAQDWFNDAVSAGERAGLEGPVLLDWYYLIDRFTHRSGLAAHAQRVTVFSTPAFIGAAFRLEPADRLEARLHRDAITAMVPEWRNIPFFKPERGRLPVATRQRIWEGADGDSLGLMLSGEGAWTELFDRDRVIAMWEGARAGRGSGHDEQVFERIACREAFEDHLADLNARTS